MQRRREFSPAPGASKYLVSTILVEAPGIEPRDTCVRSVANSREDDEDLATQHDAKRREVSASMPMSADQAIRVAAKLAIDASDLTRARALLDLLDVELRRGPVVLHARRKSP
jgi:hypothetical protein